MIGCDGIDFFQQCRIQSSQAKKISHYMFNYKDIIGKGKFSSVYRGIDTRTQKKVAVKMISFNKYSQNNLMNLLYQEAEICPQLVHSNIVQLYTRLISQNNCYLVMELCRTINLQQKIKKQGRLQLNQIQRIILDIFKGLSYLNQKGVIHRDIKTANILFSENGQAKISDFGFATRSYHQIQDIFVGTPFYMSPQSLLYQKYSQKSDIWSFGVIVYELYHGYVPMHKCRTTSDLQQCIIKPVNIDKNLQNDIQQLLQGCLQINSINRWNIQNLKSSNFINRIIKRYHIQTSASKVPSINIPLKKPQHPNSFQSTISNSIASEKISFAQNPYYPNSSKIINIHENPLKNTYQQFYGIKLQYKQIVSLIHYCRLVDRVIDIIGNHNEDLILWLLKIINFLNSDTFFVDPLRSPSTESVLKGYHNRYYTKFSNIAKLKKTTDIHRVQVVCINLLRTKEILRPQQSQKARLFNCLNRQTKLLKEALESKNFNNMSFLSQCERILRGKS